MTHNAPEPTPENAPEQPESLVLKSSFTTAKIGAADVLIRAYVGRLRSNDLRRSSFTRERIERLIALDDKECEILLKDGTRIPVRLPFDELEEKIYFPPPRQNTVDLLDVTAPLAAQAAPTPPGKGASAPIPLSGVRQKFGRAANVPDAAPDIRDVPMKLVFFAGGNEHTQALRLFVLEERQIVWSYVREQNNKTLVYLVDEKLNTAGNSSYIYVDMPLKEFMAYYTQAKAAEYAALDLRERTVVKMASGKDIKLPPDPGAAFKL